MQTPSKKHCNKSWHNDQCRKVNVCVHLVEIVMGGKTRYLLFGRYITCNSQFCTQLSGALPPERETTSALEFPSMSNQTTRKF
jgi:hypothetical protein